MADVRDSRLKLTALVPGVLGILGGFTLVDAEGDLHVALLVVAGLIAVFGFVLVPVFLEGGAVDAMKQRLTGIKGWTRCVLVARFMRTTAVLTLAVATASAVSRVIVKDSDVKNAAGVATGFVVAALTAAVGDFNPLASAERAVVRAWLHASGNHERRFKNILATGSENGSPTSRSRVYRLMQHELQKDAMAVSPSGHDPVEDLPIEGSSGFA